METVAKNPDSPPHGLDAVGRSIVLLLIVVTFAVLGPVIGTVVFVVHMGLVAGTPTGLKWIAATVAMGLLTGLSHVIGGIPAAIAGVMIGIKQIWFGGARWLFALGVGALVGAGLALVLNRGSMHGRPSLAGSLFVVATLSTLACWGMIKPFTTKVPA
jgi:hypothetical protein